MLIQISDIVKHVDRRLAVRYSAFCSTYTCPLRTPYSIAALRRLASHRIFQVVVLVIATVLTSSLGTLIATRTASAQPLSTNSERLAIIESQQHMTVTEQTRMYNMMDSLRMDLVIEREKRAELDSRLSVVQGVGFGLGSIVMVLQAASMLLGLKKRQSP